ncbi:MAG: BlaI/MecI/CopY family transcriptional regulator [Rhodanobacteraceae bacterium]|nr:BlaI/MecI/CopY family transcriptional regulator [Rhodanobacteraceae bacterium]MBP9155645.1 BlaI/MecI/CopY family transcriptional regulator [Xanthomonadales bacterium]HQW81255.1 BlaI/MecI/CopY family transcriptional regulator [Pseudomonadota bacterium]
MIQISEAESLVMDVLWQTSPLAAEEVVAALSERQAWQEATVKTLLNRLLNKQAIAAEKDGRRFLYRPLLQRDDYLQQQSSSLVDRLFEGRLAPLVSHFSAKRTLGADDIAELKQLIQDIEHGQ